MNTEMRLITSLCSLLCKKTVIFIKNILFSFGKFCDMIRIDYSGVICFYTNRKIDR